MHFSSIIVTAGLALVATAAPTPTANKLRQVNPSCMPTAVGIGIETSWISTLTNYDQAVAENLLYPSLIDQSDSINYMIGAPLGSSTFPSAQAYEAGQGSQPSIGMTILSTDAVTCDGVIALRWVAQVGSNAVPAQGITILKAIQVGNDAVVGPTGWQLAEIHTEFNSAAWITDLGGSCPPPKLS